MNDEAILAKIAQGYTVAIINLDPTVVIDLTSLGTNTHVVSISLATASLTSAQYLQANYKIINTGLTLTDVEATTWNNQAYNFGQDSHISAIDLVTPTITTTQFVYGNNKFANSTLTLSDPSNAITLSRDQYFTYGGGYSSQIGMFGKLTNLNYTVSINNESSLSEALSLLSSVSSRVLCFRISFFCCS
jgi:hypothetical protein